MKKQKLIDAAMLMVWRRSPHDPKFNLGTQAIQALALPANPTTPTICVANAIAGSEDTMPKSFDEWADAVTTEANRFNKQTSMASPEESNTKDTNPKTAFGAAKPSVSNIPAPALFMLGIVMALGAKKYGPLNWRTDPVSYSTYFNGMMRHAMSAWDGEDIDPESGVLHMAHAAANCMILIDAALQGTLIDDRPTKGTLSDFLIANTKVIQK